MLLILSVTYHMIFDGGVFVFDARDGFAVSTGKHHIAGISIAFAGFAGEFTASFILSVIDFIMQLFAENVRRIINSTMSVNVLCNYFFIKFWWRFACKKHHTVFERESTT